jgi:hypothetical protein
MTIEKCLLQSHIIEYLLNNNYIDISETKTVVQSIAFKELAKTISYNLPARCEVKDCIHCAVEAYRDEKEA